jgi:hypothetical protein
MKDNRLFMIMYFRLIKDFAISEGCEWVALSFGEGRGEVSRTELPNPERSVATDDDSSSAAGSINISFQLNGIFIIT